MAVFTDPCPRGSLDDEQAHNIDPVVYGRDSERVALLCSRCGKTQSLIDALYYNAEALTPDVDATAPEADDEPETETEEVAQADDFSPDGIPF